MPQFHTICRFLVGAGLLIVLSLAHMDVRASDLNISIAPEHPVAPRAAWERLRTFMIRNSKRWFGLHPTRDSAAEIRVVADVPYGADPSQQADLYLPRQPDFPLLVYVHGGAWISEDKIYYGVMGRFLAENGVGAVVINYRLPPEVNCDGELRDVAAAFAWTRRHASEYGGDPTRLFLAGHSAGGHLVAVVATNRGYLAAEGLGQDDIRGVVAFSGFYEINANVELAGVGYVFAGMDKKAVSAGELVCPGLPPFLLVCAAHESIPMRRPTLLFHRKLLEAGCRSELCVVPSGRHYGQVLKIDRPSQPQGRRVVDFIREH